MRISFRTKLLGILVITAAAFVGIIVANFFLSDRVITELENLEKRYVPMVDLEPRMTAHLEHLSRALQDAVAADDLEALEETRRLKDGFLAQVSASHNVLTSDQISRLSGAIEDYYRSAYAVSRRLMSSETGENIIESITEMQAKYAHAFVVLKETTNFDEKRLGEAFTASANAERTAGTIRAVVSFLALMLVLIFSLWLSRGVLRSLDEINSGLTRFGKGDFSRNISQVSRDEFGDVAVKANQMANEISRLLGDLTRSEQKIRLLIESVRDYAIISLDPSGLVTSWNSGATKLLGFDEKEIVGKHFSIFLSAEDREKGKAEIELKTAVEQGKTEEENWRIRRDGSRFWASSTLATIRDGAGVLQGFAKITRDMTERKQYEEELKRANQALGLINKELETFSYSVAHDLRAPLRSIIGFSGAIMEDCSTALPEEGKKSLERVIAAAKRMGELIDHLLNLSRVSRKGISRENMNLSELAERIVGEIARHEPERHVAVEIDKDVKAEGDPQLMSVVLSNLLGNAWKFSAKREDARIQFGKLEQNHHPVFFVRDNGAGFDMQYSNKLFGAFQRLHSVHEFEGTGIGLATVQRIIHRHNGEIWAQAKPGEGATFFFTLG
jgi:PAS domain S-box-containing protein